MNLAARGFNLLLIPFHTRKYHILLNPRLPTACCRMWNLQIHKPFLHEIQLYLEGRNLQQSCYMTLIWPIWSAYKSHLSCTTLPLVAGVSFHIGSGATDAFSFTDAIAAAREVFDISERLGLPKMHILDIGGGFTSGCSGSLKFSDAATAVNYALDSYFPLEMGVKIIAEPGRYFAETPSTLATTVIGKRVRGEVKEYWINDGIYGSMNCLLYDHAVLKYRPLICLADESKNNNCHGDCSSLPTHNSTVFGPTCDGLDTVLQGASLPDLSIGDWIIFPDMGAYTAAAGSSFNGFSMSDIPTFYVFSINLQGCSILGYLKGIAPQLMKGCVPDLNAAGNIIENWAVNCSSTSGRQISVSSGGCSWHPLTDSLVLHWKLDAIYNAGPSCHFLRSSCVQSILGPWFFFATNTDSNSRLLILNINLLVLSFWGQT